ncbi:MAG: GDSL-type esterase/lipase family protein [Bacteroidota bacterium]
MKTYTITTRLAAMLLVFLLLVQYPGFSQNKILLLGDSITEANGDDSPQRPTWRRNLDLLLTANGYSFDFIGNKTTKHNGATPANNDYDWDHQSYWGRKIDYFLPANRLSSWQQAAGYDFDIALVHLGTNDVFQNRTTNQILTDLGSLIDTLRKDNPNVTVMLAQLIPTTSSATRNANITALNSQMPAFANTKSNANSSVVVVDQNTGYDPSADNYDGVHPNASGVAKIAQKWYDALINNTFDVSWGDISFEVKNQSLSLNWETLSERNNKGFTIEFKDTDVFQDLAFVAGQGDASTINRYEYNSGILPAGNYIFRLRQEDFDGKLSYSPQFEVEISQGFEMPIWIYPNPAKDYVKLELPEDFRKALELELYDLQGRKIFQQSHQEVQTSLELNVDMGLQSGYYQLLVKSRGKQHSLLLRIE